MAIKLFSVIPSLNRRRLSRLLLIVVLAIVVTAALTIVSLVRKADMVRQAQVTLARLEHKAHEFSALEWEAMHKGMLTSDMVAREALCRREMAEEFSWLNRFEFQLLAFKIVKERYATYLQLAHQEYDLLAQGNVQAAEVLNEAQVDPAFNLFSNALRTADQELDTLAAVMLGRVRLFIFLVSAAGTGAICLFFWRFYQKQHVAAIATAEQRILQQANELLRKEIQERIQAQKRLEEMQGELIKASRHAGMQEVATGVLHNVGNVLNSVNVSASLLRENLRKSQVHNLIKATSLLRDHAGDTAVFLQADPRGQRLPGYLVKLGDHLATEQQGWQQELEDLGKNIEHIKEIVTMQQSYARLSGVLNDHAAEELVRDAMRMNEMSLNRHGIKASQEFDVVPLVSVDKHKVLQILINLIRNAKHAVEESGRTDKQIRIEIHEAAGGLVRIQVQDNGVGIAPENLAKVFQHGFTTKPDGHGFGLHSSVNAAREMGGSLAAHSDGLGCGAMFTLDLPAVKSAMLLTT